MTTNGGTDRSEFPVGWITNRAGWVIVSGLLLFTLGVASELPVQVQLVATLVVSVGSIALFTQPLNTERDIASIFRFGYGFTFVVIVATVAGVIAFEYPLAPHESSDPQEEESRCCGDPEPPLVEQDEGTAALKREKDKNDAVLKSPGPNKEAKSEESKPKPPLEIEKQRKPPEDFLRRQRQIVAVVPGCDFSTVAFDLNTSDRRDIPQDSFCGEHPPQWVLSIGGNILQCHIYGDCGERFWRAQENASGVRRRFESAAAQMDRRKRDRAAADRRLKEAQLYSAALGQALGDLPALEQRARQARRMEIAAKRETDELRAADDAAQAAMKMRENFGAHLITGGLVVPVYFVLLALGGATVGMMRKLPEYQHRSDPAYESEYERRVASGETGVRRPISWGEARDFVLFQVLQVLSAPIIGLVAYAWAKPESAATTSILAFAAGFTSETFLLAIRGLADQVTGEGPRKAFTRSRTGRIAGVESVGEMQGAVRAGGAVPTREGARGALIEVGDRVQLQRPAGIFRPGAKCIVTAMLPNQFVRTDVFELADGTVVSPNIPLPGLPASFFGPFPDGAAASPEDGPVG